MSVLERMPELVCPKCKGFLEEGASSLHCTNCNREFPIEDDIPNMLCKEELESFSEEISVQNNVAQDYVLKRYQKPYSRRYHLWWTDEMLNRVSTKGRILDNGCGVGHLFERISPQQIVGLDISGGMIRYAAQHSNQLVLGNSQEIPLRDSSFDVVVCRSLLHHLPEPEIGVREMHRVLRPGGEAVLVETNKSLLSFLPRMLSNQGDHFSQEHQNLSLSRLRRMLKPCFDVEDVYYFGYVAYPLLGFPDMLSIFRYVPFKRTAERILMLIDRFLSKIPLLRTQSWAILLKVTRK